MKKLKPKVTDKLLEKCKRPEISRNAERILGETSP